MKKLTRQQEIAIRKLLHHSHNREISQYILQTIGEHNWTRDILGDAVEYLTEQQEDLYETLGGGYNADEIDEIIECDVVNERIAEVLEEQGVTHYLYKNEEYLDAIRTGEIICEGINVDEIKNRLVME